MDIYQQLRKAATEEGFPVPELRVHNDRGLALARNAHTFLPGHRLRSSQMIKDKTLDRRG